MALSVQDRFGGVRFETPSEGGVIELRRPFLATNGRMGENGMARVEVMRMERSEAVKERIL